MKTWNAAVTKEAERRITDLMTQSRQQSRACKTDLSGPWGIDDAFLKIIF